MSELANLIEEMKITYAGDAWHGPSLMETLKDVTAEQAAARPMNGKCIWELVLHIAAWEEVFLGRLEGRVIKSPEDGDFPPIGSGNDDWQAALARLRNAHERLVQATERCTDDQLEKIVPGKDITVGFMLHGAVRHRVYHSGQIGMLKRAL